MKETRPRSRRSDRPGNFHSIPMVKVRAFQDAREHAPAAGVQSRSPASTKWAAAAWPAPSSRPRSCSIPERYIPRICDSKTVTALERAGSTKDHPRSDPLGGGWRRSARDRHHQYPPGVAARDAARGPEARPVARLRARRRLPGSRPDDGAAGVVHGDARCTAIAAASIVAKVTRDRMMLELHAQDPRYGFDRHKGYATRDHLDAVSRFGYSDVHRRSFRPPSLFDRMDG